MVLKKIFRWFELRLNPFPDKPPVQPPQGVFAFCWYFAKDVWPWLLISALLTTLVALIEVWLVSFSGNLVDWLATQDRETFLQTQMWPLIGMAVVVMILPVLVFINSLFDLQTLMGNFPMRIRWILHGYFLKQSLHFYQDEFAGRIATKLMQTALSVRECVIKLVDVLNYVSIYFLGTLFIMGLADKRLMLPLLLWLAGYILLLHQFVPKMRAVSKRQADSRSSMTGRIVDAYTNIQTVKLFSHAQRESTYARESMDDFLYTVHDQMRLVTFFNTLLYTLNSLLLLAMASVSIWLWIEELVSIGSLAIALGLVLRLSGMSQWIMWEVSSLFENIGTVQDGISSISVPISIEDKHQATELIAQQGHIRFEQVFFSYEAHTPVLTALNLDIQPGEKIGLVGRSGAGKSTLVNLLLRFYDLQEGAITIDNQSILDVTQESLRGNIGMVTQDTSLLHRSVRDNIAYSHPDASDELIIAAAKKAHAHDFILTLQDAKGRQGYDAHVGERGVKLSGGQRQRIAIARVMLKDAPILILDEATSALDSEVESVIQENLYQLMEGKTVIAIAHRLSTIAAMDRLIVMDQGQIIETGSHDELLAQGGIYASLWKHQSGGFLATELN